MAAVRSKNLLSDYTEEKNKNEVDTAQHTIHLLRKNSNLYFFKEFNNHPEIDIRSEVLISEFIRMLIPREPVTDILYKEDKEDSRPIGLLSQKVDGFKSLDSILFIKLVALLFTNSITGFGEICALLMLTCEHDGKVSGNIGINSKREVIKLDGGETMFSRYDRELSVRYPIKENDINWLPLPPAFVKRRNINWLYGSVQDNLTKFIFFLLSCKSSIRHEINSIFLKFILLPDFFISQIISSTATSECYPKDLVQQFKERKEDARKMVLKNRSFQKYIANEGAENAVGKYIHHLNEFKLFNKIKLFESSSDLESEINKEFQILKTAARNNTVSYHLSFKVGGSAVLLLLGAFILYLMNFSSQKQTILRLT